jgi:MFS family permease
MLFLGVCILLGPYFAFDNPTGTQIAMRQYFGSPSYINENSTLAQNASFAAFNQDYELLFTFYSVPNTVLPLFAGALVDKIGVRPMTIITTSVSLAGQLLVTAGIAFKVRVEGMRVRLGGPAPGLSLKAS